MNKKIISIIVLVVICLFGFNTINAESLSNFMDVQSYMNVYKMSEESDVTLPFLKVFNSKAVFDKDMSKSGLSIANGTLEIEKNISGIQTLISADTVNVKGMLEYGLILAQNVVISGTIEKDVLILAESIFVTDTANINGDMVAVAGTIEIKGNVKGNLIANSSSFLMAGNVEKDFRVYSETLEFNESNVDGAIYIETNSELNLSEKYPNAIVNKINTKTISEEDKKANIINTVITSIIGVICFTILNMIVVKIRPNIFKDLSDKIVKHSSYGILMGVVLVTTIPVILTVLFILCLTKFSVIALPTLISYLALVVVTISLAKFITGAVIFELIKNKLKANTVVKKLGYLLLIYAALYLLCNIPYIAWFATMTTVLLSAAIVITGMTKKKAH